MSVFSPLALTQALPFLPLAQGDIDYEVSRRDEPDLFDTALLEPATKVILVKDGMVAVPRGQGAIADYATCICVSRNCPAPTWRRNCTRIRRRSPYSLDRMAANATNTWSPLTCLA